MRLPDGVRRYLLHLLERDAAERALDTAEREALAAVSEGRNVRPLPELLRGWVNSATAQMRWKRARPVAAKELADHLSDQYEAFLDEGMDEEAAAQAAAREMGDAVETGTQLDRAWRPRPDWVMLGIVLVVAAAGLVLQYLLRPHNDLEWYMFFGKYVAGAVCLLAAYFVDYTILGRRCWLLYGAWVVVGLLLTFGPLRIENMGKLVYLAQWVWFFPVLFAGILFRQRGKGMQGIVICLLSLPAMWFLAEHAPSMAALTVQTVVCCGMLAAAVWRGAFGRRTRGKLALAVSPVLVMALLFLFQLYAYTHIRERLAPERYGVYAASKSMRIRTYGKGWRLRCIRRARHWRKAGWARLSNISCSASGIRTAKRAAMRHSYGMKAPPTCSLFPPSIAGAGQWCC